MTTLYSGCCGHDHLPSLSASDDLAKAIAKMVSKVWKEKGMPDNIDKEVVRSFAATYTKAVESGFGSTFATIDYDTPDGEMLAALQKNIFQFSAAKNYQQLQELSSALTEGGKLRTFSEFKEAAMAINDQHINQWFQAEYNLAVSSSQMAATWVRIQDTADTLPMLQYSTAGDDRVRDDHAAINGVIKPVDDPFWDTYYPPNGWNCRCDVQQLSSGKPTADSKTEYPTIPKMFETNMGKKGLVFPPKHPYYNGCPKQILNEGENLID